MTNEEDAEVFDLSARRRGGAVVAGASAPVDNAEPQYGAEFGHSSPGPAAHQVTAERVPDEHDDTAEAGPVLEGELVVERPAPAGCLAQRAGEVAGRGLVPEWARSRDQFAAYARWWTLTGAKVSGYYVLRSPLIAAKLTVPAARGVSRSAVTWRRWIVQAELAEQIRRLDSAERAINEQRRLEETKRVRGWISAVIAVVSSGGVAAGALVAGPVVPVAAAAVAGVVFIAAGWRSEDGPSILPPPLEAGPLTAGAPLKQVSASVQEALGEERITATVARMSADPWGWTATVHSEHAIPEKVLEGLERRLQARQGAVTVETAPDNAALRRIRITHTDPLAGAVAAEHHRPGALTCTAPLVVGLRRDQRPLAITTHRTHLLLVGATGSAKSGVLSTLLNAWTGCRNLRVEAIDLTQGPAFANWHKTVKVAYDPTAAEQVLANAVSRMKARIAWMNAEIQAGRREPDALHWTPDVDGPELRIVIDEYATLAENPRLLRLVQAIARTGRKACVLLALATNDASSDEMRDTIVRGQVRMKIMLPCSRKDVEALLGAQMRADGWRPDRLLPENGDDPRDAGKAYIHGLADLGAEPVRFSRITGAEARQRDAERAEAGLPAWDQITEQATATTETTDAPAVLAGLHAAIVAAGGEVVTTTKALEFLRGRGLSLGDGRALANEINRAMSTKEHPAKARDLNRSIDGARNPKGFRLDEVEAALAQWRTQRENRRG